MMSEAKSLNEIEFAGFIPDAMYGMDYETILPENNKFIKEWYENRERPVLQEVMTTAHDDYAYLVPEVIAERVYEAAFPNLFARQLLDLVVFKGTTYTIQKGVEDTIKAYTIGELIEPWATAERYTEETVTPEKYAVHVAMSEETIEDARIAILPRHIRLAGEALAKYENTKLYTVIKNGGTAYSGSNPITLRQILDMMTEINAADWEADTIVMHPYQYRDLMLTEEWRDSAGRYQANTPYVEGHLRGEKMNLWGTLNVIVSSTATAGTVVVMDRKVAGIIAQNRAITAKRYEDVLRDARGYLITERMKGKVIWSDTIQVGTGFGTT